MKETVQFGTQLVMLLTALIGLYKVANFTSDNTANKSNPNLHGFLEPLKPLLLMASVFGFMLIIPLFSYFMTYLTNATTHINDSDKEIPKIYQTLEDGEIQFNTLSEEEKNVSYNL